MLSPLGRGLEAEGGTGCGFTAGRLTGGGGLGGAWDWGLGGGGLDTAFGGGGRLTPLDFSLPATLSERGGAEGVNDELGVWWPAFCFPGWTTLTEGAVVLTRIGRLGGV